MLPGYVVAAGEEPPSLIDDAREVQGTIYMGFASFMILVWDHIITFHDEVEYIWKGRKGALVYLFLLNRYLTPFGFIINLFAYLSPVWTPERCEQFVRYEGSMTVTGINTTALMMFLRVYALYLGQPFVITGVLALLCTQLGVNAWLLSKGVAVVHNKTIHACTMVFDESVIHFASASAWLPLLYDTVILILTLNRTLGPVRTKTAGKIVKVLLRDGILYYSVIFAVNLVLTIMIASAPAGLQNITAQLEYLLTVAMMSRITLHLKKQAQNLDGQLNTSNLITTSVPTSPSGGVRSLLRFTHPTHTNATTVPGTRSVPLDPLVSVVVQETTVMHDDDGNVVPPGLDKSGKLRASLWKAKKGERVEEWFEMEPTETGRVRDRGEA